jgi:hypothetical protein
VDSFRNVVSTVADGIPVAEAGRKLKELRLSHPDAFRRPPKIEVLAK